MKVGEIFVIQWNAQHGSYRILPLRTVVELGRSAMRLAEEHLWVCVGYDTEEGRAAHRVTEMKKEQK